jgi:hypothetical protein
LNQSKDIKKTSALYNNYSIGLLSIVIALLLPIILPFLGSFLAPFLFIAGVVAVIISKVSLLVKSVTILPIVILLVIFWKEYEMLVMNYMPNSF